MATYKHLRSSTANKRPTTAIADGQLAINTNTASPGLFFKDSAGTGIVKIGPVHVGTTAPNSVPASGGSSGNYTGEQWLDTSVAPAQLKVWNGSAWVGVVADELPVSKLQDGAAGQIVQTDSAGTGVEWSSTANLPLGSAAAPAYRFQGDANSGVYSPGADQVAISTGGTGRLFIRSDGSVSVGAASSAAQLYVFRPDGVIAFATVGTTKAIRIRHTSDLSFIEGVDPTLTASYQPLSIGGSDLRLATDNSEKLRITSTGAVGIGTSSPSRLLTVNNSTQPVLALSIADSEKFRLQSVGTYNYVDSVNQDLVLRGGTLGQTNVVTVATGGNVGIGTTSPSQKLEVSGSIIANNYLAPTAGTYGVSGDTRIGVVSTAATNQRLEFHVGTSERARIDSSGRLLVGTSTSFTSVDQVPAIFLASTENLGGAIGIGQFASTNFGAFCDLIRSDSGTKGQASGGAIPNNAVIGSLRFNGSDGVAFKTGALIRAQAEQLWASGDCPTRLVFSTTPDGSAAPVERMRINNAGMIRIAQTTSDDPAGGNIVGTAIRNDGIISSSADSSYALNINRKTNDGNLVAFSQDGTTEGTISVSGSTVSYNGAHLSRWSQLVGIDPYDKNARPEILRGTVMSNLDEMCDWTCPTSGDCQDNEQLNKTEISSVDGDPNVAGVFQSWDDDDDIWVNDFYLAMTGDFVIRIAAGTTVQRGDLLCSAGDGTARPQGDRYIKDSTIAKVTSTTVSCTHPDGSYCVPCVLMAC